MRRLFLIFALLAASNIGWSQTCGSGYTAVIPVKLIQASGSDQTNFPFRVIGRDWRLATVANGGLVNNVANNSIGISGPADIQFCPDQTGTGTPLKFESTLAYNATTGDYEFWGQQPTLHTGANDTVYLYVGKVSVVTSQQDLSLWSDVNYVLVNHYGTITSLGLLNSVTGTAATNVNTVGYDFGISGAAQLGKGNASKYLTVPDSAALRPSSAVTLESWVLGYAGTSNEIISKPYRTSGWSNPFLAYRMLLESSDHLSMDVTTSGVLAGATGSTTVPLQTYIYAAGTYADGGAGLKAYLNGALDGSAAKTGTIDYGGCTTCTIGLGTATPFSSVTYWQGMLDEQRIASDAKSADWIMTNYLMGSPYVNGSVFSESSWTKPTLVQIAGCDAKSGSSATCTTAFSATNGGTLALSVIFIDATSATCPATTGFTLQVADSHTGTLHTYQSCFYTAPITSSGVKSVTLSSNPGGLSAILAELQGVSTTGISTATAGGGLQPVTMTASCGTSSCIQMCLTNFGTDNPSGNPVVVNPSSMRLEVGPTFQDTHEEFAGLEWQLVGSGSQSCSFPTAGAGYQGRSGVAMILPFSAITPSASVRHRVVNE